MARTAVLIHDLAGAKSAAARAAGLGLAVDLVSAPGAGATIGPAVFKEIVDQAKAMSPKADVAGCLDCGEDAGTALNALRHGVETVIFNGTKDTGDKLRDIADQSGCRLLARTETPPLDLDEWLERTGDR